jgi:hypothetical protein
LGFRNLTVPPSASLRFSQIFLNFTDFFQNFQKPTGSPWSEFSVPA